MFGWDAATTLTFGALVLALIAFVWAVFTSRSSDRGSDALQDAEDRAGAAEARVRQLQDDRERGLMADVERLKVRINTLVRQLRECRADKNRLESTIGQMKGAAQ